MHVRIRRKQMFVRVPPGPRTNIPRRDTECSYGCHLDPVRTFVANYGNVRTGLWRNSPALIDHPRTNILLPGTMVRRTREKCPGWKPNVRTGSRHLPMFVRGASRHKCSYGVEAVPDVRTGCIQTKCSYGVDPPPDSKNVRTGLRCRPRMNISPRMHPVRTISRNVRTGSMPLQKSPKLFVRG